MLKRTCYGLAGAALLAGGAFLAADYGLRNPDSAVGRSVCAVCGPAAEPVALPGQPCPGEEVESVIPDDPVPVAAEPVVVSAEDPAPAGPVATGPNAITIPDEEPAGPAVVAPLPPAVGSAEECEPACPAAGNPKALVMPYCPAESAPRMPHAADDEPQTVPENGLSLGRPSARGTGLAGTILEFLSGPFSLGAWAPAGCPDGGPCPACTDPIAGHGRPVKQAPIGQESKAGDAEPGGSAAPLPEKSGAPTPGPQVRHESKKPPAYFPALRPYLAKKGLDGMEECEAPAEAGPQAVPARGRPVVDTMEFRPSDGRFDDGRRGPW